MNRLKVKDGSGNILLGGMPIDLADFDWMDTSVRGALEGFFTAFGNSFILSGLSINHVAGTHTAGWIVLNGEVLPVDAGSIPSLAPGEILHWALDVSYDPGGLEQFESGVTHDTYEVRKAVLTASTPSGGELPVTAPSLMQYIAKYVELNGSFALRRQEPWILVGGGGPIFENGWANYSSPFGPLRFIKDTLGFVVITGAVTGGTPSSATPIFTLPDGYRPEYQEAFIIPSDSITVVNGDAFRRIIVYPDGKVSVTAAAAADYTGGNNFVGIPNIRFRVS